MSGMAITALWASEFSNGIQANATCRLHRAAFHRTPRRISLTRIPNGLIKGIGGSVVSGSKKIGRRKKSEHTETEAAEGASDGGKTRRRRKSEEKEVNVTGSKGDMQRGKTLENEDEDLQLEENDDECNGNNYENNWPPLVCCFGAAQNKFVPISARHMTPEVYMTSEGLHWNPAEFVRARGGPPSNVAIALAQLGGRVAFMGKVGNDAYGRQMVITFNMNNVETRGIRIDSSSSTSVSYMKLTYQIGKLGMSDIKPCAEDSLLISEINVDLLKEVRMFHFNSMVLLTKSMRSTLHAAIKFSRKCGGIVFFDVNLPLPLWRSRDETWRLIQKSWNLSNVIEVSKQELEFLLGEDYREKRRKMSLQYSAHSDREMKPQQHYCYTREELFSLWHDDIKLLIVNDGANLYYYTTTFEGSVPGAEAVVATPFICDRSATNDAFVAVFACKEERQLRKLLAVKFSSTDSQESAAGLNRESEVDDKGRNPPVLTIIAGIVVFLLFSWVLGSIVLFIVGLFLK